MCFGLCLQQQNLDNCSCLVNYFPFNDSQLVQSKNRLCYNHSLLDGGAGQNLNAFLELRSAPTAVTSLNSPLIDASAWNRPARSRMTSASTVHPGRTAPTSSPSMTSTYENIQKFTAKSSTSTPGSLPMPSTSVMRRQ